MLKESFINFNFIWKDFCECIGTFDPPRTAFDQDLIASWIKKSFLELKNNFLPLQRNTNKRISSDAATTRSSVIDINIYDDDAFKVETTNI
mmetsp:Transcript_19752/g.44850  ORF Transcript_19752/g.44850 Transcript_19752/m.44850 type:complete len:91 (-) Transcript_19752:621-893(-)